MDVNRTFSDFDESLSGGDEMFSPAPSEPISEEWETRADNTPAAGGSGMQRKRKRTEGENINTFTRILNVLKETAASLRVPQVPVRQTKYDWVGGYISATLNDMDPEEAEAKCNKILQVLINKNFL